jgi:hypothetical protein
MTMWWSWTRQSAVGRLPRSLRVYAIEGETFELGDGLSPRIARAAAAVADELLALSQVRGPSSA